MATVWGALSKRAQLGIDVSMSPTTVGSGTSSVTLTWTVYLRTTYAYAGTYGLQRTGTGPTGTTNVTFSTSNGQTTTVQLWQGTQSVSTSYSGTVSRSMTATLPASGSLFDGAKPTVTRSFTVPQRPPSLPSAPTSATVTRNSDTRQDVTWVRPANAGNAGTIWTNAVVQRQVGTGSWGDVATLAGTATSWSDTATTANQTYRYRVYGSNSAGRSSTAATTANIDTTPAAPTNVVATKSGADIVITWTDSAPYNTDWEIRDNGVLIATIPNSPPSYTHTSPSGAAHTYTVRAKTDGPVLYSAWATSNTVQVIGPPNAPTGLTPNGTVVDADGPLYLEWIHNPVDTSGQTAMELQHRLVGSSTWTTVSGGSWSWYYWATAAALRPSGSSVEWRVRTKGAHANWSPYSAVATFYITSKPVVGIVYPDTGTHDEPDITVEWSYYQADSHPQTAWQVQVRSDPLFIRQGAGSDASTTWTSQPVLQNGESYDVRVRVRESTGLWSDWATRTILVAFDPPSSPEATVEWVPSGYYEVTGQATSEGGFPETATLRLERSVNGEPWQVLADDLGLDFTYFDWTAPMVGYIRYQITAISVLPSTQSIVVSSLREPGGCGEILLGGGPGFAKVVRLTFYEKREIRAGRESVLNQFDGRSNPVPTQGVFTPLSFSVSAVLAQSDCDEWGSTTARDMVEIAEMVGNHYYRDHDGWTFPCHLSEITVDPEYFGRVNFTVTRVDHSHPDQLLAIARYAAPMIIETRPGVYTVVGGGFNEGEIATWGLDPDV